VTLDRQRFVDLTPKTQQSHKETMKLNLIKLKHFYPELVPHTCNPSYSGGRDQENAGFRPTLGKKFKVPMSTDNGWVWWVVPVIPSVWEATIGGSQSRQAGHKHRTLLEK
jgi:hypothetical protein